MHSMHSTIWRGLYGFGCRARLPATKKETRGVDHAARSEMIRLPKFGYGVAAAGDAAGEASPPSAAAFL